MMSLKISWCHGDWHLERISVEPRHDRVKEDATSATDFDCLCLALARDTSLWIFVHTAMALLIVGTRNSNASILAPIAAPRILDQPVLLPTVDTVADQRHRVVDHPVLALIEDTVVVHHDIIGR